MPCTRETPVFSIAALPPGGDLDTGFNEDDNGG